MKEVFVKSRPNAFVGVGLLLIRLGWFDMDETFLSLARLASGSESGVPTSTDVLNTGDNIVDDSTAAADAGLQLYAIVSRPQPNQFVRHSWEHLQHAREAKKLRGVEREVEAANAEKQETLTLVAIAGATDFQIAQMFGLSGRLLNGSQNSIVAQYLAVQPKMITTSRTGYCRKQEKSVAQMVSFAAKVQDDYVRKMMYTPKLCDLEAEPVPSSSRGRVEYVGKTYTYQFDCASQRLKCFSGGQHGVAKRSMAAQIAHTLMQKGSLHTTRHGSNMLSQEESEPLILTAVGFDCNPDTAMYLEAILPTFPLKLEDPALLSIAGMNASTVLLYFISDRASTNYTTLLYMFILIARSMSPNLDAHLEPCGCHGASLVKGRSGGGKRTSAAVNTFTRLTKDSKFAKEFARTARGAILSGGVEHTTASRPQWHRDWATNIVSAMCPDGDSHFWRNDKHGRAVPTRYLQEVYAFYQWYPCIVPITSRTFQNLPVRGLCMVHPKTGSSKRIVVDAKVDEGLLCQRSIMYMGSLPLTSTFVVGLLRVSLVGYM